MYHKHYSIFKVKGKRYCLGCLKVVSKKKKPKINFKFIKELKEQDNHIKEILKSWEYESSRQKL